MRPDPYKQARSRQYLARQRAKHGEKSSGEVDKTEKLPRWLKNLPSNADRYEKEEDVDSGDEYDISSKQQLEMLLENLKIETKMTQNDEQKDEETCKAYEKWTGFDIASLEVAIASGEGLAQLEVEGLSDWFVKYWSASLDSQNGAKKTGDIVTKRLNLSKLQKDKTKDEKVPLRTAVKDSEVRTFLQENPKDQGEMEDWLDKVLE
jgi:hypothetical protein